MTVISVSKDFSRTPGPRFARLGSYSGEAFRDLLRKKLRETTGPLIINLDDVEGYGSSFLEEAFGGLVRAGDFEVETLRQRVKIEAQKRLYFGYAREAQSYFEEALDRRKKLGR